MSQLKQVVENALRLRQVSPEIITSVDTLIQRAIVDLSKQDLIPSRTYTFTSLDKKQEYRDSNGDVVFNFYYLPDDFRKLDYFRPRDGYVYTLAGQEYDLYRNNINPLTEEQIANERKRFIITHYAQSEEAKQEKILIVRPFPADDIIVDVRYYSNGSGYDWDWLGEEYWEVIISWVYNELGLTSRQDLEEDLSDAVAQNKEMSGHNIDNKTYKLRQGTFFGNRPRDSRRRSFRRNNLS